MPSREQHGAPGDSAGAPGGHRPLPPHPDIAYEKKRAKRLLRDARAGDADALAAMARVAGSVPPAEWKLALAQLAVAREYGFASWPRLAAYYGRWAVLERLPKRDVHGLEFHESQAREVMQRQAQGIAWHCQMIATHLPRLYAKSTADVIASPITIDEARFIVARQHGCADWAELQRRVRPDRHAGLSYEERRARGERERIEWQATPEGQAFAAIRESDLQRLKAIVEEHPEFVGEFDGHYGPANLASAALRAERETQSSESRAIVDWLAGRGADVQTALDQKLMFCRGELSELEHWIRRGANPNRVWPNGYSTLEHALVWYNVGQSRPAAVEALLCHVSPVPRAFWIAAGIGDVNEVRRYVDRRGRPTAAARRRRPDFAALGPGGTPFHPDGDDETVIFEAFWVAVLNGRTAVLEVLLDRGFPVDAAPFSTTALHMAVACGSLPSVKCLLERGADPDARQLQNRSPRWLAGEAAQEFTPRSEVRHQIAALLASWPAKPGTPSSPA